MSDALGLVVYSDAALSRMTEYQLADSISYYDPDVIAVPQRMHELQLRRATQLEIPIVVCDGHAAGAESTYSVGDVDLVPVFEYSSVRELPAYEQEGVVTTTGETYLLSELLAVEVDLVNLDASLDGREEYEAAFPATKLDGSYTHVTMAANPEYRTQWDTLAVQGALPGANTRLGENQTEIAFLELYEDGVVCADTVAPDTFGLLAIHQVGRSRAEALRAAGYRTREALANASVHDLQDTSGFGVSTAKTVIGSATATVSGEVHRIGDDSLPGPDPVFIDIETDGLNPSMVWLIGVLDRQRDESYLSLLARDPDDPGTAVEAFIKWVSENVHQRPIVAYNGFSFDFPVLEEHIERYCPQYLEVWRDAWTFDPYYWATRDRQVLLPGRTNKLEDVASALGWESDDTGLTGAAVARLFQRWLANPCAETELEWERHERYCEDDVRALAHVYDAIAEATPPASGGAESPRPVTETSQGTLSDF